MIEVEFEAGTPENPVRTIVNSDGELLFPDGELEYDIAVAAMGGLPTNLVNLDEKWRANPIPTIIADFDVPETVKCTLLIDSAEHVLPVLEKTASPDQGKLARRVIKQCRIAFSKDESEEFEEAMETLGHLMHLLDAERGHFVVANNTAAKDVCDAVFYATERLRARVVFTNLNPSCAAAANAITVIPKEWEQAYRREELWEIAHFVELMKALYDTVRDGSSPPHK